MTEISRKSSDWGSEGVECLKKINFQVKMQGFTHFYCEKLLVERNLDSLTHCYA